MSTDQPSHREGDPDQPRPTGEPGSFTQEIRHQQVSARVPERVARGVFSNGAMVLQGPHEFVLDFVLRMAQPNQIVARVILPFSLVPSTIQALRENLSNYQKRFGSPPALPTPPDAKPPTIEEIYDQLKMPDDTLSGSYANAVMISHTPSEFCFDFITNFYPRSAVSCRVFLSAPQVFRLLETLTRSFQQFQQKIATQQRPPGPEGPRPGQPGAPPAA
jgi:hypothetical protein